MRTDQDISAIFRKFAGGRVSVREKAVTVRLGPHEMKLEEYRLIRSGNLVTEMNRVARNHGLTLRFWLPNMFDSADFVPNRANVYVEKEEDGAWRIQKNFTVG
jgi:hypothetical protein